MAGIIEEKGYVTINDPACGGGVMLVAACAHMKELGYNINRQVCIYAQDIDSKCANMTYIQLALLGVPAVVVTGNTLPMEARRTVVTPMWHVYGFGFKEARRMREAVEPKQEHQSVMTIVDCNANPPKEAVAECYSRICPAGGPPESRRERTMEESIEDMLKALIAATAAEREAKGKREYYELAIAAAYKEQMPVEGGAKTFEVEGIKFEVKTGYRFSADVEAIKGLPFADKLLRTKVEFVDSQYKKLWEMNKEAAQAISAHVTATPAKPAVKVKEVTNA